MAIRSRLGILTKHLEGVVNNASGTYISTVTDMKPDPWNYRREAGALLPLLEKLEEIGFLKILVSK